MSTPTRTRLLLGSGMILIALFLSSTPLAASFVQPTATYSIDFLATAATGIAMNNIGDVTGTSYPDPGCGPFCLPTLETVVWRGGQRIVLPTVPGLPGIYVVDINDQGWVAGFAGFPGTTTHAVVWKPVADSYLAIDLGTLPGTTISQAMGIDNQGRVVGWSTTATFPPNGSPFMWTESGGLVDLSAQGYPDEEPIAMSPGGTVATPGYWYRLGDPGSVAAMPQVPVGFYPPGTESTAINDAGDQARFLVSTSAENLRYLFRFQHAGTWQQISFTGNGNLSPYGVGSINEAGDVSSTILGAAMIAFGPDGLTQSLSPFLSTAYPGSTITTGGPMNDSGQILARVMIGQSPRLVRLTPATACDANCIKINNLQMFARFIQDPQDPGHCTPGGNAFNLALVRLTVTNKNGTLLPNTQISGRFLDDYWTNAVVSGTTNGRGVVSFFYQGPCGVGAIAFLVDDAVRSGLVFDQTMGVLSGWAIPQ